MDDTTVLNKTEAAQYLGISVKTLERRTSEGKVTAQYQKGRSKPSPVYNRAELDVLKAQMPQTSLPLQEPTIQGVATERQEDKETGTEPTGESVAIRLPLLYARRLEAEAGKRGMEPEAYGRSLLIDALEDGERIRLRDDIAEVGHRLDLLGRDIASSVLVLLLLAGRIESDAEARDWVKANLTGCLPHSDGGTD